MDSGRSIRRLAAVALCGIVAACGGGGAGGETRAGGTIEEPPPTLTLGNFQDSPPPELVAFLDEVEELTDGSLTIELANEWRAGEPDQEQGMLEDIEAGELDMGWVGARALEGVGVTSFQALLAPLLVDSYELEEAVFEEGIAEQMLADIADSGLTGIAVLPGPLRKMMGIAQPFTTPADFAGQVVGFSRTQARPRKQTLRCARGDAEAPSPPRRRPRRPRRLRAAACVHRREFL